MMIKFLKSYRYSVITVVCGIALAGVLGAQYLVDPQNSLLGYFVLNDQVSNPQLAACQVTADELPSGGNEQGIVTADKSLAGQSMRISGSSVLAPMFTKAAERFDAQDGTSTTVVQSTSGQGLQDVYTGNSDIGISDIYPEDTPQTSGYGGLDDHPVAVSAFTLIVTNDLSNTVHNLTVQQIRDIYSGKVSNWHTLGGPNESIQVVNRKQGSGTRVGFEKYVLGETNPPSRGIIIDTTSDLLTRMPQLKGAIAYVTTAYTLTGARDNLFPVCINGFGATETNISRGAYQFWNFEHAYTKAFSLARPITRAFIGYICGSEFQTKDILSNGFLLPNQLTQSAIQTHEQSGSSQNCSGDFGP